MKSLLKDLRSQVADRDGFVLPMVIFGLVLMSTVAVAALVLAGDEHRSSRAMRESAAAFYAAEAGLHEVWATWPEDQVEALQPGQTLDLGWKTLDNGSSYRAVIQRYDDGSGEPIYSLVADGRAVGPQGGQRTLSLALTTGAGSGYKLGKCCEGPITARGTVDGDNRLLISGKDTRPPGWEDNDFCSEPTDDKPGIIADDEENVTIEGDSAFVEGNPPIEERPMTDADFDMFGDLTWEELKNQAEHVIDGTDGQLKLGNGDPPIQPSYNADGSCNTADKYNWGSNDPNDSCYDHFPIVLIQGEVELFDTYGQAIIIIDWDETKPDGEKGGELEFEQAFTFAGVVLGKGCVEVQRNSIFYGAMYVDGAYRNEDLCGGDKDLDFNKGADLYWSQCAVDRAMVGAGLDDYAKADNPGGARPLGLRAFSEVSR